MIFKTIDADATNLTKKMGLLGKSFNDIKKDYSNGLGITKSLFSTSISESDWKSLQKFNSAIKVANDGLTKSQRITKAWNENMTGCSIAAKRMGNDLVTGKKKISDVSSAMKTATASTKALEIAMNVFANVGFMLAITAVTKVISELAQAQSNAVETAKEATSAYNDELSSIKDYKEKISELNEELNSGNLSYEETKTKRSELMSIQDELIEKFGTEKSAIESVTEAIGGQVDALDDLNEKSYRDWIAKADDETIWTKLLPWGKSGLDQAIDYMESKKTVSFFDMANANSTTQDKYQAPITDEIRSIQEEIDKTIQSKYNLEKEFATFKLTGTPEEIKSQLESIRQDYLDLSKEAFLENGISSEYWDAYRSEAIESINDVINQFDEGLEKHQETYKTYIEGMIKYDSEYSDEYATILRKRAELEDAENSGDTEKIQKARQEFMDAITAGITASESDENIKKYFESLYPELQAEFANWNFEIAINANTDNLKDEAEEIGKQYSATDLLDMVNTEGVQEGEEAFNKLIDKAIEYGVCTDNSSEEVQKLIDLLVELGIVQGNIESDVQHEIPISKSITENINDLEDLNKELDKLGTAMANIDDAGNFDLGDLDAVADYFLGLKDIPYNVTEVSNALKTLGDGTSTLEQQKDAINSLADEYLKTSGILDDLNESNAELIQLQLQRMGIENAEEIVNTSLQNEQAVLQQKAQLQQTLIDQGYQLINVTWAEIEAMQNEGIITQQNAQYLAALALQKQIQNGALDESANIANLQALAAQMGSTGSTISYWLGIIAHAGSASVADKARENATNAINETLNKFSNTSFKVKVPKAKYNGGSPVANKLNKNNGGGSNSKSKEQKSINEIDLFKRRVDVLNDALELLQKNLDNVTGYDAKNTLLNQSIAITQEEIKNYSDAVQMYSAKASEALSKVPKAYRDAAQNGKVELLTEEVLGSAADENDKSVKELIDSYTGWADSVADAKQKLAELKTELRQLELDKFKNIVEDYTNRTDIFENSQDLINKQIDLFKEAGQVIGEGFYQSLIDEENSKLSLLTEEQQKLIQEMESGISNGTIEKGTDEWNEMLESLNDVNGAILDSKKSIEEFNNSIQQLHWDTIERIKNDFSELSDEIDFLYNLLEDDDHVSDDFGNWSDNALAQLGLMAQSYEQHVYASQKLQGEIDELSNAYKRGEYSETEYLEKLYDLKDQQRSEVEASEQAKDSIVSLAKARTDIMVNAINKEVDTMSELIDKKKEALSAEKSLHEYRKSIEESSNNITKIEQQLAAMQGDDTASTIAKRKKLEEELANAKKEREEQEYSHSIEAQQDALDQQLEDFKESKNAEIEALQQYLENQEQVIFDAFEIIKQNTETVASSISLIAQDHGYQVSDTLTSSWYAGENAITSYNQAITDASSIFAQNLTTMQSAEWSLQQQANATAMSVASVYTASAQNLLNELTNSYVAESNLKTMTDALRDSLVTCLDRGYNIGNLVTQLHGVADAANSAASAVSNLMNAFAGAGSGGTYQYGTGNTVYYYDNNGQKHVTSKSQAEKAGYTAPTSDRPELFKKTSKKAKGGLITNKSAGSFDPIAELVGEDHMIAVKDNETVLTPVQTQGWLDLIDNLDAYNKALQPNIIKPNISNIIPKNSSSSTITLNYDHLIEVQGDVNNSNIRDIENAVSNSVNEQIKQFTTALKRVGVR